MSNRKAEILDLSMDLIREKGYVAFSYDDISKQLGVTKASIHYHFEKKEDLAVALTSRIHQGLQSLMVSGNNAALSGEEKIKRLIVKQLELAGDGICPISSLQTDYESLPRAVQEKVQQLSEFELGNWTGLLKEAQREGIVKHSVDVESLAFTVLSCIKGGLQYKRALKKDILPQITDQIDRLIRC